MTLDNFRTIELVWDKADKSIIKTIKTSSSDTTGRYLSVKILDEGQEVTLNNAKLQLYWEHPNFNTSGTDEFNTVNNGGLFRLTFSDEMLTNIGELNAHLVLTLSDGKITSDGFPIQVFKGADDGVVVPTNGNGLVKQIDGKIDKGNVTLNDLTQDVKLAMTGGSVPVVGLNSVGTENIKASAVTPQVTSFFKKSTNLYNPATTKKDVYYGWSSGQETSAVDFYGSGLIPVKPNTKYFIRTARHIIFTKADGTYLSAINDSTAKNDYVTTTPSDTERLRISWKEGDNSQPQQVNEGSAGLEYEPYREYIPKENLEKQEITNEDLPQISISSVNFSKKKSNLFDKSKALENKTVSRTNGTVSDASGFVAYENLEVDGGETYIIKAVRAYAFKDATGKFISGSDDINFKANEVVTAPVEAKYINFSWYPPTDNVTILDQQVNEGSTLLPYEDFGYYIPSNFLENSTSGGEVDIDLTLNLPPEIYALTDSELNIYFDNISSVPLDDYQIDVTSSLGKQLSDRWTATPTTVGNHPITISVYKNFEMVAQTNSTIKVKDKAVGSGVSRNALVIGDSTIAQDYLINHLEDTFAADAMTVNFKGTLGTYGETHNEGYAGWTVSDLRTNKQYKDIVHPFYNPQKNDFDFAYYITNQGYTNLNHVILCFGINDTFSFTSDEALLNSVPNTLTDFDYIVNDIKSYNANIKIGVCVTIPPNASQDAFGETYSTGQTQWRYKRNNALWINRLISHFENKTNNNIYLIPDNSNIDTKTGFRDGVHPNKEVGDKQRADTFYYWLKSFEG